MTTATLRRVKAPAVTNQLEMVTPLVACEWLEANTDNRKVSNARVQEIAQDIREGRWQVNGDAIRFAEDGRLIDGQHRLWAIFEANVAVETYVVRGLDFDEVMPTVDTGRARSYRDVLAIRRDPAAALLSPVARLQHRYLYGGAAFADLTPSHGELDAIAQRVPTLYEAIDTVRKLSPNRTMQPSILAFVYANAMQTHPVEALEWVTRAATGVRLTENDAVMLLRNRFEELASSRSNKLNTAMRTAYAVKSWNQYVTGDTRKILIWRPSQEAFPRFAGNLDKVQKPEMGRKRAVGSLPSKPAMRSFKEKRCMFEYSPGKRCTTNFAPTGPRNIYCDEHRPRKVAE